MGFLRDIRLMTLLMILLIVVVVGMIGFAFYQGYLINQYTVTNVYNYGVFVDDIHLGGMTRYEAEEAVLDNYKFQLGSVQVTLRFQDEIITLYDVDMIPTECIHETLDQAYNIGREGTPTQRLRTIQQLPHEPVYLYTSKELKYDALENELKALFEIKTKPPKNASVVRFDPHATKEEHRFTFSYEEMGKTPRYDLAWERVRDEIESRSYGIVVVAYNEVEPAVTVENLKEHNKKIDACSTKLTDDADRNHNIILACDAISGYVLGPEETFDFNLVVGERAEERGFEKALNEQFELKYDVGVSQAAGTLYYTAVQSGMKILERHANPFVVPYMPCGTDAFVDDDAHNLMFKNPHETPVYIIMWADDVHGTLTAEIYGAPLADSMTIDIIVDTVEEIDPEEEIQLVPSEHLEQGETQSVEAQKGAICHSYRVYQDKDGNEINRELLYEDRYEPLHGRLYYHHGDPPPTP